MRRAALIGWGYGVMLSEKLSFKRKLKAFFSIGDEIGNPTIWLTRAYVMAFLLIGLFTVVSHHVMGTLTARQIEGKEIAYLIGEESSLMRDISYYANSYYKDNEKFDRFYFSRAVENLKESERHINAYLDDSAYSNRAKDSLLKNMREEPISLDKKVHSFLDTADKFAAYSSYVGSPEKDAAIGEMRKGAVEVLPKLLDKALSEYQSAQIEEMVFLSNIERYAAYGVFLTIILEALLIFQPLARKVGLYHTRILKQAMEDTLTGLRNRRAFVNDVEFYQKGAKRDKKGYVAAICDLDKFKSVNDTYGHDVGDIVLKHFANVLQKSLRSCDIVARFGGEEFVIVLTNVKAEKGLSLLERVRHNVENTPCYYKGSDNPDYLKYTVSIGFVTVSPGQNENIEESLKRADGALYDAKATGRNKVIQAKGVAPFIAAVDGKASEA